MENNQRRPVSCSVIAAILLLMLTPVVFYSCRGERARWQAAVAYEQYLDGHQQEAISTLEEIIDRTSGDDSMKFQLTQWYLDQEDPQKAITLADELAENRPDSPEVQRLLRLCLMGLGEYSDALALYKKANRNRNFSGASQIQHLNALAYYRALADEELEQALIDSDSNIETLESDWNASASLPMSATSQVILCSGLLYRDYYVRVLGVDSSNPSRTDVAMKALEMLSRELARLRVDFLKSFGELKQETTDDMADDFPLSTQAQGRLYQRRASVEYARNALVALLSLRAIIYQDVGILDRSMLDRISVEDLGYEAQNVVDSFPGLEQCGMQLQPLIQFLDTRACVEYKLGLSPEAYWDIAAATSGAECYATVVASLPFANNELSTDLRLRERVFVEGPKRDLAVILFHRSWILRLVGRDDLAQNDLERIRQLGFTPGNQLF